MRAPPRRLLEAQTLPDEFKAQNYGCMAPAPAPFSEVEPSLDEDLEDYGMPLPAELGELADALAVLGEDAAGAAQFVPFAGMAELCVTVHTPDDERVRPPGSTFSSSNWWFSSGLTAIFPLVGAATPAATGRARERRGRQWR